MLAWVVLISCVLAQCCGNYTMQEMEAVLNTMYENPKYHLGCATPIKCKYLRDGVPINATGTGSDARCCYDCDNCVGDRCYRGWQCCRDTGQEQHSLIDDSLLHYADFLQEYVKCEKLFVYEKTEYRDGGKFETEVNENPLFNMDDREPVMYQMISSCPSQFNDSDIKAKCEYPTRLGSILNLMPFLSKSKLHLYKNMYCVKCHNPDSFANTGDRFLPLNLLLSAEAVHYKYSFISMFETVHDVMNFTVPVQVFENTTGFRIVMQASTLFLDAKHVNAWLIPPCGIQSLKETECRDNPSYDNGLLKQACDKFYAPIRVKNLYTGGTYIANNLACAVCRSGYAITGTFSPMDTGYEGPKRHSCASEMTPGPTIVMNIQPAFDELFAPSEDIGNQRLTDFIQDQQDGVKCESGFFRDMASRQCRCILCPRRHYIYRGQCEPIYKETSRHSYYVKIKVTPINPPAVLEKELIYIQEEHLIATIINTTGMNVCFRNILVKATSTSTFNYVIYQVGLIPVSIIPYMSALAKLKALFDSSFQDILTKTESAFDGYRLESGAIVHNDLTHMNPNPVDSTDGVVLISIKRSGNNQQILRACGGLIDISKQDLCYRLRLEPKEYKIDLVKSVPRLNVIATGKIIYRDDYDILLDGSARICIEDYGTDWQPGLDRVQTTNAIPDTESPLGINTVLVIVIAAVFCLVTFATLISRSRSIIQWFKR